MPINIDALLFILLMSRKYTRNRFYFSLIWRREKLRLENPFCFSACSPLTRLFSRLFAEIMCIVIELTYLLNAVYRMARLLFCSVTRFRVAMARQVFCGLSHIKCALDLDFSNVSQVLLTFSLQLRLSCDINDE